jgi:hypothetical protein
MVRKQVYIEPRQDRLLKARARQLGVTEAELIRDSLEHSLASVLPTRRTNPAAAQALMRFFRRRANLKMAQTRRTWTRDELYDRPRAAR